MLLKRRFMATLRSALLNFRNPYWTGMIGENLGGFQNNVTNLLEELRTPGTTRLSPEVLGRISTIFTNAAEKYRFTRHLTHEERQVHDNLKNKFVEWQIEGQYNISLDAAIQSIDFFVDTVRPLPPILDPFRSEEQQLNTLDFAQPAPIPTSPTAPARIIGDTKQYVGTHIETLAGEIISGATTKFEFVDCSYQPGGKERTNLNALINWEKATELKFSNFKTLGLDLSSATNLEKLVIENSPDLQSLVLPSSPNLKYLLLSNNAALEPEALYSLLKRSEDQLINIDVIINGCQKISQKTAMTLIRGGLIKLYYTPSQPVGHLHKTLKVPNWLKILGIGLLAIAGIKLVNFLQRHFFKTPLRG